MKRCGAYVGLVLAAGMAVSSAMGQSAPSAATQAASPMDVARQVVELLKASNTQAIATMFTPQLAQALTVEGLAKIWKQVLTEYGPLKGAEGPQVLAPGEEFWPVIARLHFERCDLMLEIGVNKAGQIGGIYFKPVEPPAPGAAAPLPPGVREAAVFVGDEPWKLGGTLTLPGGTGPFPAVVLVHGSGPLDRDETVGPNKPFRDLAYGLAARGVVVLRYEKRTKAHGEAMAAQQGLTVQMEIIDDALAAVRLLRRRPEVDSRRVFVLGHSLGGMMVPRIARQDPSLAGVIAMAGPARPLADVMLAQMRFVAGLDGVVDDEEQAQLNLLQKDVARAKSADLSPAANVLGAPGSYWLDLREYDPAAAAAALTLPILVLHPEGDYQVTAEDLAAWQKALAGKPNATIKSYPGLMHLFMPAKGTPSPHDFETPGQVSPAVIGDVAAWVLAQPAAAAPGASTSAAQ